MIPSEEKMTIELNFSSIYESKKQKIQFLIPALRLQNNSDLKVNIK